MRKAQRDEKKAALEAEAQKRTRRYQRETQANAQRVLRAIEAAGLPDREHIPWESMDRLYVGLIRQYAAGEFPDEACRYGAELSPSRLGDPAKTAKVLGCSTDYLLGGTDGLGRAEPPPPPIPPPALEPAPTRNEGISAQDREALDKLYDLLEDAAAISPDIAAALRWAISVIERALGGTL